MSGADYYQEEPSQEKSRQEPTQSQCVTGHGSAWYAHSGGVMSEPVTYDHDLITLDPEWLKDQLKHKSKVKIAPILLIAGGLPHSCKTIAIQKMLKRIDSFKKSAKVERSFKNSPQSEKSCIGFYDQFAACKPSTNKVIFASSEENKGYPSVIYSGIQYIVRITGYKLKDVNTSSLPSFDDQTLNKHFNELVRTLRIQNIKRSQHSDWDKSHPNGVALINVWDVGLSKIAAYILPLLSGYLYNSHVWMFLDLLRDADDLSKAPAIDKDSMRKDSQLIMKWRSRIQYFLRVAKLAEEANGRNRKNVCKVIASLKEPAEEADIQKKKTTLANAVQTVSQQMQVDELIDTEPILFKAFDDKCADDLYELFTKTICNGLSNFEEVPFSFLLLRSMYYNEGELYISKREYCEISQKLDMSSEDFNEFCRLFTSFGSIIDVSLIDHKSDWVILKPAQFMNELEKLFYYTGDDTLVTKYGVVSESTSQAIFDPDNGAVFMSFLESLHIAVKLLPSQIDVSFEGRYAHYVPNVCTAPPILECSPTSLHFLRDINVPLSHFKVLFAAIFLQTYSNARLEMLSMEEPHINITRFHSSDTVFELVYLGDVVEFRFSDHKNIQEASKQIIRVCHQIMEKNFAKYNFAIICMRTHDNEHQGVCKLRFQEDRHLLPFEVDSCDKCSSTYTDACESIDTWNRALSEDKVPDGRELNGEYLTVHNIATHAEKLAHLSEEGAFLFCRTRNEKIDSEFFERMILDWKMFSADAGKCSKKDFAVIVNSTADGCNDEADCKIFEDLALGHDLQEPLTTIDVARLSEKLGSLSAKTALTLCQKLSRNIKKDSKFFMRVILDWEDSATGTSKWSKRDFALVLNSIADDCKEKRDKELLRDLARGIDVQVGFKRL